MESAYMALWSIICAGSQALGLPLKSFSFKGRLICLNSNFYCDFYLLKNPHIREYFASTYQEYYLRRYCEC